MHTVGATSDSVVAPERWRRALSGGRTVTQSGKRLGDWISRRPVRGHPGLYRGGQAQAAAALGANERTIRRAEQALISAGFLVNTAQGRKRIGCSRFALRMPESAGQNVRLTSSSQPGDGVRLTSSSQPGNLPSSMTKRRYEGNGREDHAGTCSRVGDLRAAVLADIAKQGSRRCRAKREPGDVRSIAHRRSRLVATPQATQAAPSTTDVGVSWLVRAACG